jgi:3-phosphoglycerate kinase
MATRLHFIFDGGPDDESRTLREVADGRNNSIVFGHLAKWVPVSAPKNIWALEVDVVDLDRRPIVAIVAYERTDTVKRIVEELSDGGTIVLERARDLQAVLTDEDVDTEQDRKLQRSRISVADYVFVVNEEKEMPAELEEEIAYAQKLGRRVQFLNYGFKPTTS